MTLVDSHCHIDFEPLLDRLQEVLENARANGIHYLLCVSVNLEDFPRIVDIANTYPHIFASVGVHPNEQPAAEASIDRLVELSDQPKVIAIGETGLDYYRSSGDLRWQRDRFYNHIEAAKQVKKPLIIHTRDAAQDTMDILRGEKAYEAGGVMHCFAEDWSVAQQALDIGFYISFSGIVTFKNAKPIQEVAQKAPLDRILVETDSPYLAPVPFRGKTNEPAYVKHTAEFIAELRGMDLDDFSQVTTNNFFTLFDRAADSVK